LDTWIEIEWPAEERERELTPARVPVNFLARRGQITNIGEAPVVSDDDEGVDEDQSNEGSSMAWSSSSFASRGEGEGWLEELVRRRASGMIFNEELRRPSGGIRGENGGGVRGGEGA
jgi:hypothetical protein